MIKKAFFCLFLHSALYAQNSVFAEWYENAVENEGEKSPTENHSRLSELCRREGVDLDFLKKELKKKKKKKKTKKN